MTAESLQIRQRQFVIELEQIKLRKYVWFMDSCSVNPWANLKKKTWTSGRLGIINGRLGRIVLPLQSRRGHNRTIFGIVGAHIGQIPEQMEFRIP